MLLGLAHFGALPVPNLQGELVERRRDDRQRRKVFGVDVALYDLRRDGGRPEAEPRADSLFDLRVEVRERADRAADLAHSHRLARALQTRAVAPHLVEPEREGEAERGRLGVDAVRAAHLRRGMELERAPFQDLHQRVCFLQQQVARVAQQQSVRRVHHVRGREAVVDEARGLAD